MHIVNNVHNAIINVQKYKYYKLCKHFGVTTRLASLSAAISFLNWCINERGMSSSKSSSKLDDVVHFDYHKKNAHILV